MVYGCIDSGGGGSAAAGAGRGGAELARFRCSASPSACDSAEVYVWTARRLAHSFSLSASRSFRCCAVSSGMPARGTSVCLCYEKTPDTLACVRVAAPRSACRELEQPTYGNDGTALERSSRMKGNTPTRGPAPTVQLHKSIYRYQIRGFYTYSRVPVVDF